MHHLVWILAASTVGIDYGWQPNDDGSTEYIIQLEPALIEAMQAGVPITSEIPAELNGVRCFRIQVGEGNLPRQAGAHTHGQQDSFTPLGEGTTPPTTPLAPPSSIYEPPSPPALPGTSNTPSAPPTLPNETGNSPWEFNPPDRSLNLPEETTVPPPSGQPSDRYTPPGTGGLYQGLPESPAPDRFPAPSSNLELLSDQQEDANDSHEQTPDEASGAHAPHDEQTSRESHHSEEEEHQESDRSEKTAESPGRPWIPFVLTLLGLFASIGVNIYLGWVLVETLSRYRRLLSESHAASATELT